MKKNKRIFYVIIIILIICCYPKIYNLLSTKISNNMQKEVDEITDNMKDININIILNNKTFSATLYNNETVQELITKFPITIQMNELNSNEYYKYLDYNLPTNEYIPSKINKGDIKLYGNNCLVIFYQDFESTYKYTDLGKINNVNEFINELRNNKITITLELN